MSELLQLLTGAKPYPIPPGIVHLCEDDEIPEHEKTTCPHCNRTDLSASDFYVRSDGRLSSWCKKCLVKQRKPKVNQ